MAMRDVGNMENVGKRFSNIVIPMLWFEITLEKLPDSLRNRFNLYLNVLPVLTDLSQYGLFVVGISMLLFAVTRVSMKLSNNLQPSHKVSRQRKYSSIYPDMIQRLGEVEKVYELNEKSRKSSISRADLLYDVDLNDSEKKFMLDEEPAISDDESSDSETKSNCDINSFKNSEIGSLKTNATDTTMPYDGWHTGEASSSLNDIANDDFTQILHIEEASDESTSQIDDTADVHEIEREASTASMPRARSLLFNNSISDLTDDTRNSFVAIPITDAVASLKPCSSDVSISLLLDADDDDSSETFENDDTFASANVNLLGNVARNRSSTNASFRPDHEKK